MKKFIYFFLIVIIVFLSFSFYSSLFYPALNSDNAVTILMVHYFKLPHDLYCWSLDRFGSLIPLIAQIPNKLFNLSTLLSESITRYLILLLGFLAFSSFFDSRFYKIIFAVVWFLPPIRLIDITQFSFGIHYSLMAIACYLIKLSENSRIQNKKASYHIILFCATLILITTIWVSDMALVSVTIILCVWLFYFIKEKKLTKPIFMNPQLYYVLCGIITGYCFIHYAKSTCQERYDYKIFGDFNTIKQTITIFLITLKDFFIFKADEPFTSIYSYMVVVILGIIIVIVRKIKINDNSKKKWGLIFLLDAIILFSIIIVSKWTFINHVPRRYFTCTYIAFSFTILLIFDNLSINKMLANFFKIFIFVTVFIGGIGSIYNLKYIWPKTLTPTVKIVGEFQQLGKIGVIAEYWNSYITSCVNPDMIKATPHDKTGAVRNYKIVDEVFKQKNIYVIKDMWLATFPDTLNQFGRILVKNGNEFKIGNCNVCKYNKLSTPR